MSYLSKNRSLLQHNHAGFINILALCAGLIVSTSITVGCLIKCTYKQTLKIIAPPTPFQKACDAINNVDPQALADILDYNDEQEPGWAANLDARFNGQLTYTDLTRLLHRAVIRLPSDDEEHDNLTSKVAGVRQDVADSVNRVHAIRSKLLKTGVKITDAFPDDYIFNLIVVHQDDHLLFTELRRIAPYRALRSLVDRNNENLLHIVARGVMPKTVAFLLSQGVNATQFNRCNNTPLHLFLIHLSPAPHDDINSLRIVSLLYEYGNDNLNTPNKWGQSARELARSTLRPDSAAIQFIEDPDLYKKNNPDYERLYRQSLYHSNTIKLDQNIARQLRNKQIYGSSHR